MNSENKNKYEELVKADYGIEFQNEIEKEEIIKSLIAFSEIIYNISKNENHQLRIVSNNNNITQLKKAA